MIKKKKKRSNNIYLILAVCCLITLFTGYNFVYEMAQARKANQEITTISIEPNVDSYIEGQDSVFINIMSKFNIFFNKTYKNIKKDDDSGSSNSILISIVNFLLKDSNTGLGSLKIFDKEDNNYGGLYRTKVYLANEKKEDFFTLLQDTKEIASRNGNIRESNIDYREINEKANIVIYHTHGTESYLPQDSNNFRSQNEEYNVLGIGKRLSLNLSNLGLDITHIGVYNDLPTYNSSYIKSYKAVNGELDVNKKNILIDIHRDAAEENSSYEKFLLGVSKAVVNNKKAATFSIIIGGGNGNIEDLKDFAKIVKKNSDQAYPGLCREIVIRPGSKFNQELSDYSLLIEIGSIYNTIEEAEITCDLLSNILSESIIEICSE